jgi:large subunit ribosomal protein L7/L12
MSLTNQEVVQHLGNLSVMQLCELTRELEAKWGVQAVPQGLYEGPIVPQTYVPVVEEQTEFEVVIEAIPENKIAVIKLVRELTGKSLAEAKDFVEGVPKGPKALRSDVPKAEADDIKAKFEAVGCKVALR